MPKDYPILLAVHSLPFLGERLLSGRWDSFIQDLRLALRSSGIESQDSTATLLLFNYDHPHSAITGFFENFEQVKKEYDWEKNKGTLPLQIVFHLERKGDIPPPFRVASARIWEGLQHEALHLSRALKMQWEQLMAGKSLPSHQLDSEANGLFLLKFADSAGLKKEKLFPHRLLIAKSGQRECFYCGMTTHKPAACPAKLLTMESRAIATVGYQSIAEISERFREAVSHQKKLEEILAPGVGLAQLRQDPLLRVFVGYFDLLLIYQPRYLWHIAFSIHPLWDGTGQSQRIKVDSRNLQTGLDCLRVGQHNQAYELLMTENQLIGGKQFYAMIGLAFIALERGRMNDVAHHLQIASGMATQEKEKIYISLLLSRFHDLAGHSRKAEQSIQPLLNLYVDCHEVLYRKVQLLIRAGNGAQALRLLAKLIDANRIYFITALMDPALLPIQGLVEDILAAHARQVSQTAAEELTRARNEYEALEKWFDCDDPDLLVNLTTLAHLEEQFARTSYYDFLDVIERARALNHAAPRLQEAKLDGLNERVDEVVIRWGEYNELWNGYVYKTLFTGFHDILRRGKRKLIDARSVAGESLARANSRLESAQLDIVKLKPIAEKMHKVRIAFDTLKVFVKKLLITETVLCLLLFLLYPVVALVLPGQFSTDFIQLIRSAAFQKNIIFITTAIIGPAIAFAQTVRAIAD